MSHRSQIRLLCDLCDAKLVSRTAFDAHMRDVHGTVSMKPQMMVNKIDALIASMPKLPGDEPIKKLSVAELEEQLRKYDEKDRTCPHCKKLFPSINAVDDHKREVREEMEQSALRFQFKSGWLTFRAAPGEADGMVLMPMQMGPVKVNYVYAKDGSWIQFPDTRMRDRYVAELRSYLESSSSDLLDTSDRSEIKKFIAYAESATPWDGSSLRGGSGRHRGG